MPARTRGRVLGFPCKGRRARASLRPRVGRHSGRSEPGAPASAPQPGCRPGDEPGNEPGLVWDSNRAFRSVMMMDTCGASSCYRNTKDILNFERGPDLELRCSTRGDELGSWLGPVLGLKLGLMLGDDDGYMLGSELGLRRELGNELGLALGFKLGPILCDDDGCELGLELGKELGIAPGNELVSELGQSCIWEMSSK